jgi:transposase-like protein
MGETHDRAEALRLKLASSRDGRKRVPVELRQEAVAFTKAEHTLGQRYKTIAKALGVKAETLMRWCRASHAPKFARVVVKRAPQPHLTVHGPAGTRIEQLSIQQVAELFGALSCSD